MQAEADIVISGDRLELKEYQLPLAGMFYNLVAKNKNRLEQSFPVTVESCETPESTKNLLVRFGYERRSGLMLTYGIYLKNNSELIGHIFAKSIEWKIPKCELGYWIDSGYEGRGYVTEALTLLSDHCFKKLQMKKLFIRIIPGNEASRRVAEKAGFVKEGLLRNEFRTYDNQRVDVEYYGKTTDSY